MSTPYVALTLQAAALSLLSSFLAQAITAYQADIPLGAFSIDPRPIVQFFVYALLSTPPNVWWQTILERSLPGTDRKGRPCRLSHTLLKTALDQSIGSVVNNLLFLTFVTVWPAPAAATVDAVVDCIRRDMVPMLQAGWTFWPIISLGNFALVQDVATRNLIGGIAGVAWGIYMAMFAAGEAHE